MDRLKTRNSLVRNQFGNITIKLTDTDDSYRVKCRSFKSFFQELNLEKWSNKNNNKVEILYKPNFNYKSETRTLIVSFGNFKQQLLFLLIFYWPKNLIKKLIIDQIIVVQGTNLKSIFVQNLVSVDLKFIKFYQMNSLSKISINADSLESIISYARAYERVEQNSLYGLELKLKLRDRIKLTKCLKYASNLRYFSLIKNTSRFKSVQLRLKCYRSEEEKNNDGFMTLLGLSNNRKKPLKVLLGGVQPRNSHEQIYLLSQFKRNKSCLKEVDLRAHRMKPKFLDKYLLKVS